jgi:uncharacterized protein YndB with AHSA1/START domain
MNTAHHPATAPSIGATTTTVTDAHELILTRSFEAPLELVWDIWTDPNLIPNFWGPREHSNELLEWNLEPGGTWRIVTTLASGGTVDFHGEFLRIERPSLLEWTFGFDETPPLPETLYLDEQNGVTTMRSVSAYPTREILDMVLASGMEKGAAEMHDRFAELLAARLDIRS